MAVGDGYVPLGAGVKRVVIHHEGATAGPLDRDRRGVWMEAWIEQELAEARCRARGDRNGVALHRAAQVVVLERMVLDRSN